MKWLFRWWRSLDPCNHEWGDMRCSLLGCMLVCTKCGKQEWG